MSCKHERRRPPLREVSVNVTAPRLCHDLDLPITGGTKCSEKCVWDAHLGPVGTTTLGAFLYEPFKIEPRTRCEDVEGLPVLTVYPAELFLHIMKCFSWNMGSDRSTLPSVEIYGGVANACVAAEAGVPVGTPTDLDARFYVKMGDCRSDCFDRCRQIVEAFLLQKLHKAQTMCSNAPIPLNPSLIRSRFFQKQVRVSAMLRVCCSLFFSPAPRVFLVMFSSLHRTCCFRL